MQTGNTWDVVVTTYYERYRKLLKYTSLFKAYIQSKILYKTIESVVLDCRRSNTTDIERYKKLVKQLVYFKHAPSLIYFIRLSRVSYLTAEDVANIEQWKEKA